MTESALGNLCAESMTLLDQKLIYKAHNIGKQSIYERKLIYKAHNIGKQSIYERNLVENLDKLFFDCIIYQQAFLVLTKCIKLQHSYPKSN